MSEPASPIPETERARSPWGRAWARLPVRALALSLAATLLVWGPFLGPGLTLSPDGQVPTVASTCRVAGPSLRCAAPHIRTQVVDPGAPAWQEMPVDYLLRNARAQGLPRPSWNPWVGSGSPLALDGINTPTSPTRWLLSRFPGEQGRDVLAVARFLSWTLGIVLAAALCGAGTGALAAVALAAALAPYPASYVDIVFLDVDLLGPWFLVVVLALASGRLRLRGALALAAALGLLAGALGFLQALIALCAVVGVVAASAASSTRGQSLALGLAVGTGILAFAPTWRPILGNLDQFITSRSAACFVTRGVGATEFWRSLLEPAPGTLWSATVTLAGAALVPFAPRPGRFALLALLLLGAWVVLGLPGAACALPLVSGARFARHLLPHVQMIFLVLVAAAAHQLTARLDRRTWVALGAGVVVTAALALGLGPERRGLLLGVGSAGAILGAAAWGAGFRWRSARAEVARREALAAGLVVVALAPFLLGGVFSRHLWEGDAGATEVAPLPQQIDPASPLGAVRAVAHREDRRHYGAGGALYPNWGAALEIPDLLFLGALYPAAYHELNATLFRRWPYDPQHGLAPDRFVPVALRDVTSVEFQRVLVLHRVSLLTFPIGWMPFRGSEGPYDASRCRPLAADRRSAIEAWVCPDVGGIGFFPESVTTVQTRGQALEILGRLPPAALVSTAVIGPEVDPHLGGPPSGSIPAGKGRVLSFERAGDDLAYLLDVDRPGPFVIADTFFRGWTATVNGRAVPISRANVAFKAVQVPRGRVELKLHFAPAW